MAGYFSIGLTFWERSKVICSTNYSELIMKLLYLRIVLVYWNLLLINYFWSNFNSNSSLWEGNRSHCPPRGSVSALFKVVRRIFGRESAHIRVLIIGRMQTNSASQIYAGLKSTHRIEEMLFDGKESLYESRFIVRPLNACFVCIPWYDDSPSSQIIINSQKDGACSFQLHPISELRQQ